MSQLSVDRIDREILEPETGLRALWLLYKRGAWGYLEDFGLERSVVEPLFIRFESDNVVTSDRLTIAQCRKLVSAVPGSEFAAQELQLAYALKFIDGKKHADLDSGDSGGRAGIGTHIGGEPVRGAVPGE